MIEINLHHLTMVDNLCWLVRSHSTFIMQCDMLVTIFGRYTDLLSADTEVCIIQRSTDFDNCTPI